MAPCGCASLDALRAGDWIVDAALIGPADERGGGAVRAAREIVAETVDARETGIAALPEAAVAWAAEIALAPTRCARPAGG